MERLTNKREADAQRKAYETRMKQGYPRNIPEERFLRLAAYEDTGLEPCDYSAMAHALEQAERAREDLTEMIRQIGATGLDRLRELAQADKEGISPCTFCRFNPPSSGDGKPCCMCPAEAALRRKQDEKGGDSE